MAKTPGPGRYAVHFGARPGAGRSERPPAPSSTAANSQRATESGTRLRVGGVTLAADAPLPASLARRYGCASEPTYAGINSALYLGRDPDGGGEVVVKVLREGAFALESDRLRLQRDVERSMALRHIALPRLIDTGEDAGRAWVVREHVPGESLEARLVYGVMSVNEAMLVASQVTGALAALHDVGVIHRDVRPGHIVLGPAGRVVLLDAGLGRPLPLPDGRMTRGAIEYAAPEVLGAGIGSQWTDLYALGATLFEMLTGAPPHDLETAHGANGRRAPGAREPSPLPPTVAKLLDSLLAANMRDRPRSAHVLLAQLDESAEVVLHGAAPPAAPLVTPSVRPSARASVAPVAPAPAPAPAAARSLATDGPTKPIDAATVARLVGSSVAKPSAPEAAAPEPSVIFELIPPDEAEPERPRLPSTQPPPPTFDARAASRPDPVADERELEPVEIALEDEPDEEPAVAPAPPPPPSVARDAAPTLVPPPMPGTEPTNVGLFAPVPRGRAIACEPLEGPTTVLSRDSPLLAEFARPRAEPAQPAAPSPAPAPSPVALPELAPPAAEPSAPRAAPASRTQRGPLVVIALLLVTAAIVAGGYQHRATIARVVADITGATEAPRRVP